jgi:hypothetical protein
MCRTFLRRHIALSVSMGTKQDESLPLSIRCTMPGRMSELSKRSRDWPATAMWWINALTKVPFQLPAPGCTTMPGSLFTAIICLSCDRQGRITLVNPWHHRPEKAAG